MNEIDIKDYLALTTKDKAKKVTKQSTPEYSFEIIFDNGSDFVIERSTSTGIKRQLCCIAGQGLIYIRNVHNGEDKKVCSKRDITTFLNLPNREFTNTFSFKNNYFNVDTVDSFTTRLYNMYSSGYGIEREIVKYGINPETFFGEYIASSVESCFSGDNKTNLIKVLRRIEKYPSVLQNEQIKGNEIVALFKLMEQTSIDYLDILLDELSRSDTKLDFYIGYYGDYNRIPFIRLIKDFNFDFKTLVKYLFHDLYVQGIGTITNNIIETYYDCLKLQTAIYDGKIRDKYPQHLKERHDKSALIFNLNKEYFETKMVEHFNKENVKLEYKGEKYMVILAKTSQELIEEGINLHHCVGTYVDRVKRGDCAIFFMREVNTPDESLVTIEVQGDNVTQAKGLADREITNEERTFIKKWCKVRKLNFVSE